MFAYIWFELTRKIKNPKTWFLIIVVCILSFLLIGDYRDMDLSRKNYFNYTFDWYGQLTENNGRSLGRQYENGPEISMKSSQLLTETGTQIREAAEQGDYSEWLRLRSFDQLIYGKAQLLNIRKCLVD